MSDFATDIHVGWERRITLVPRHHPGHLTDVADHLPRTSPILKTVYTLDHIRQEFSCLGQAIRGPCHLSKQHKTGKLHISYLGGDDCFPE